MIGNSLKFTFQGHVDVSVKYDFSVKELHVTVSDTGIGIKQEERDKLFEMFNKIDNTIKQNTSGIGLGLSISKQIIDALGGKLEILPLTAFDQKGTSISFTIKAIPILSMLFTR